MHDCSRCPCELAPSPPTRPCVLYGFSEEFHREGLLLFALSMGVRAVLDFPVAALAPVL